jgi:hypothetical protein
MHQVNNDIVRRRGKENRGMVGIVGIFFSEDARNPAQAAFPFCVLLLPFVLPVATGR